MALTRVAAALVVTFATIVSATTAAAQSVVTEIDLGAGYSTEHVKAAVMQTRVFGETLGVRFYADLSWAEMEGHKSDAFASAYPYEESVRPIEAYAEKVFQTRTYLAAVRAGRFRTPFGLSNRSDHAYNGFLRAPLIRYGDYWALSNTFLEGGADLVLGRPDFHVEAAVGAPQDENDGRRSPGLDKTIRVQKFYRSWIVGASHLHSQPTSNHPWARGALRFTGIDFRWMKDGLQFRGEWITGKPFDQGRTTGWYLDGLIHRPFMGRVTAVARVERLDYEGRTPEYPRRATIGARIRLPHGLSAHVNALRQTGLAGYPRNAFDFSFGYTRRYQVW